MIEIKVRAGAEMATVRLAEDGDGLLCCVARELGLEEGEFQLLDGFPPRPLDATPGRTARELGVKDGALLILRHNSDASGARVASGPMRKPPRKAKGKARAKRKGGETEEGVGESKSEVADKLVAAFQGGPRDNVSVFLRKASRQAVAKQYEIRAGNDRYAAALAGKFTVTRQGAGTAHGTRAVVEYSRGSRGATANDDVVLLSEDALGATMRYILAVSEPEELARIQDFVRPAKMAEVSPATFWSLVEHAGEARDLEATLRRVAADVDWSFLDSRRRAKSDKARQAEANEREVARQREERKAEAAARKRAREAAASPESRKRMQREKRAAEGSRKAEARKAVVELLEGHAKLARKLTAGENAIASLTDVAVLSPEAFHERVRAIDQGVTLDTVQGWLDGAREHAVATWFADIVEDPALQQRLADELHVATPCDLARLRVPGRVDMVAAELGLDKALVKGWQVRAQELLEAHNWLRDYRTAG